MDTVVCGYSLFFGSDLQLRLWVAALSLVSFIVSVYAIAARLADVTQVNDDVQMKVPKDIFSTLEKVDVSRLLNVDNISASALAASAYRAGITAGNKVNEDIELDFMEGPALIESIDKSLSRNDVSGYVNPEKVETTRQRIFFLRGALSRLRGKRASGAIDAVEKMHRARLGVAKPSFDTVQATGGTWGLDVGWSPQVRRDGDIITDLSLRRLVAIRVRALREAFPGTGKSDDEASVRDEVVRRYRFVASRDSFKRSDATERYDMYWNIVWG
jgi:hypothetical protein